MAGLAGLPGLAVGPFGQQGLDEPFDLAVGASPTAPTAPSVCCMRSAANTSSAFSRIRSISQSGRRGFEFGLPHSAQTRSSARTFSEADFSPLRWPAFRLPPEHFDLLPDFVLVIGALRTNSFGKGLTATATDCYFHLTCETKCLSRRWFVIACSLGEPWRTLARAPLSLTKISGQSRFRPEPGDSIPLFPSVVHAKESDSCRSHKN